MRRNLGKTLLLLISILIASCDPGAGPATSEPATSETSTESSTTTEASTTTAPEAGEQSIVLSVVGEIDSLDPHHARRPEAQSVSWAVAEGLLERDQATLGATPSLAESWTQLDDLTWEFQLRQGVTFTDGSPFNADVVIWNYERAVDPDKATAIASGFSAVNRVEKVDDYTVRFVTDVPYPQLEERLIRFRLLSPAHVEEIGDEAANQSVVGTGAYMLEEWDSSSGTVNLVANPDYWGTPPPFPEVTFIRIEEEATAIAQLLTGEVDIVTSISPDQVSVVDDSDAARTVTAPTVSTIEIRFDVMGRTGENEFQERLVRLAANLAVDKEAIFEELYAGLGTPMGSYLNPLIAGYDPSIEPYPYDPDAARELLAEAGYPDGFDTQLHVYPIGVVPDSQLLGEAVAAYLAEVGIRVEIVPVGSAEVGPLIREGQAGPMLLAFNPAASSFDPGLANTFIRGAEGNVFAYYADEEVQTLYEEAEGTLDQETRLANYRQIQQIIHDEAPFLFLGSGWQTAGVANDVEYSPSPDGQFRILWAAPRS